MALIERAINFKKVSLLLKKENNGKNTLYSIKNGKPIYAKILNQLIQMINNNQNEMNLNEMCRHLSVSNTFIQYPISKFASEDLITIKKVFNKKIVYITDKNRKNVIEICNQL